MSLYHNDQEYYENDFNLSNDTQIGPYRMRKRPIEHELMYKLRRQNEDRCKICDYSFNQTNHRLMPNLCNDHQPTYHWNFDHWNFDDTELCCRKCFVKCLLSQNRFYDSYVCPLCDEDIDLGDIMGYVNKHDFQRLDDKLVNHVIRHESNFINCPAPDCKFGFLIETECNDQTLLAECKYHGRFCIGCRRPAHTGKSCQENHRELLALNNNENSFYQWCKKTIDSDDRYQLIKECPTCYAVIERDNGCPMMSCSSCGHLFNWDREVKDSDNKFIQPLEENERKKIRQRIKRQKLA